ncbi:MAG: sporulation protein YtfJ [Oscillospiraceae bacterium]|nr:sporulation protein YtfJ [Oscillospiraceae bacterium]
MSKNVSELLAASMSKVRDMVDANTVVGAPITVGEVTLIPVSKISFGLGGGGMDLQAKAPANAVNFGGGAGCGMKITPLAFLVLRGESVRLLSVGEPASSSTERLIEQLPELTDKLVSVIDSFRKPTSSDI